MCPLSCFLPRPTFRYDLLADAVAGEAEARQDLAADRLGLAEQAEQDVLGPDVVVVQQPRLFLGQDDDVARSVSESLEHALSLPGASNPVNTMLIIG